MGERRTRRSSTATRSGLAGAPPVDPEARVVAITGVRSFIGLELLKRLEEDRRYAKIVAFDIKKPDLPLDKAQFYKVDLTLPGADGELADHLEREGVDTVLHAAFLSKPTHSTAWAHELEDIGTMHVLNACAEARVHKFVLASTTLVYGANAMNPNFLTERHELRGQPRSRFVLDKVAAEMQVRRFAAENPDAQVTVLRLAATLGPTVDNLFTRFFSRPIAPVMMGFDPLMQFVHEQDAIDAFKLAIDKLDADVRGEFNIVGDGVLPYSTLLALMGKFPLPLPHPLARTLARALWAAQVFDSPPNFLDFLRFMCVADGARARQLLGFRPRHDLKATVRDFLGLGDFAEFAMDLRA